MTNDCINPDPNDKIPGGGPGCSKCPHEDEKRIEEIREWYPDKNHSLASQDITFLLSQIDRLKEDFKTMREIAVIEGFWTGEHTDVVKQRIDQELKKRREEK